MFYQPAEGHSLPHNPLKALVTPRPIGWIGSLSGKGEANLAPFSFFNLISDTPPMLMFSSSGYKDSVAFIEETKTFTANLVSDNLRQQMNASSVDAPRGVSEFAYAGLTAAASRMIAAPRVGEAFASLECVLVEIKQLHDSRGERTNNYMVIGEVVGVHLDEAILSDGLVDISKARPVSRLGYMDYATVDTVYQMMRPRWEK